MNYNPYAAPQAAPPPPPGAGSYTGTQQPWEIGGVLTAAFEGFKANWVVLVFSYLLSMIITVVIEYLPRVPSFVGVFRIGSAVDWALMGSGLLLGIVVMSFFWVGLYRIYLTVARGQQADFGMLFSGADRFLPMLLAHVILGFAVTVGFALLIVPGVIVACGLCLSGLFIVDQGLGPVEALQASWQATIGHKMQLFLFFLVGGLIMVAAEMCCCLPVFAAAPTVFVAMTIIYLRITGRGAPPTPPAGQGYVPPGGGPGYGPPGGGPGYGPPGGGPGYGPPGGGGGYPPPGGGGGYPPPGGGGYMPPGGGGGYGPPGGGGGYPPPGGGGGYGPPGGGGGYPPPGGGGYPPPGGGQGPGGYGGGR